MKIATHHRPLSGQVGFVIPARGFLSPAYTTSPTNSFPSYPHNSL